MARIYSKNPLNNRIDPRKIIKTEIKEKSEALRFYNKAAKEGLAAAKMSKMAEGLGRDFIKFSVSNNKNGKYHSYDIIGGWNNKRRLYRV